MSLAQAGPVSGRDLSLCARRRHLRVCTVCADVLVGWRQVEVAPRLSGAPGGRAGSADPVGNPEPGRSRCTARWDGTREEPVRLCPIIIARPRAAAARLARGLAVVAAACGAGVWRRRGRCACMCTGAGSGRAGGACGRAGPPRCLVRRCRTVRRARRSERMPHRFRRVLQSLRSLSVALSLICVGVIRPRGTLCCVRSGPNAHSNALVGR